MGYRPQSLTALVWNVFIIFNNYLCFVCSALFTDFKLAFSAPQARLHIKKNLSTLSYCMSG